jgi:asparagine synthase (glutamine-hydrolysing)
MVHRGPDGSGEYHFDRLSIGMRRLAVIDLKGGQQPLRSRGGRVVVFQNGEIYNHRELRVELERRGYTFQTSSDTEVIAHGYDAWSIDGLLQRLDGMYAVAIHDQDANEVHLARDRFGEKPLFYSNHDDGFAFGSTLLAVSAMPWVSVNVDPLSLQRYMAMHFVPGRRTIFRDVNRVLPGERLTVQLDRLVLHRHRYYTPSLRRPPVTNDEELAEHLEHAVESRLLADVPVGVFLSGGVDSSVVAAIASRSKREIATFSMGFDNRHLDESEAARKTAQHIGARHHEFVFDRTRFQSLLGEVAAALDEPVGDQALLPVFWLSREVRKHVTVVLSGEGADEVFAGYNYYQSFVDNGDWRTRLRALLDPAAAPLSAHSGNRLIIESVQCTSSGFPLICSASDRARLLDGETDEVDPWEHDLTAWLSTAYDPLQRATAADLATWLADDLLVKLDRMTMAHSVEGRAPFLSPPLVEIGLGLPQNERMTRYDSKLALRRIASRYLPDEIAKRPKQGFVLPMRAWLEAWFKVNGGPTTYFGHHRFPHLDSVRVAELVSNDLSVGVQRERLLFAIVVLLEWWTAFQLRRSSLIKRCGAESGYASAVHS